MHGLSVGPDGVLTRKRARTAALPSHSSAERRRFEFDTEPRRIVVARPTQAPPPPTPLGEPGPADWPEQPDHSIPDWYDPEEADLGPLTVAELIHLRGLLRCVHYVAEDIDGQPAIIIGRDAGCNVYIVNGNGLRGQANGRGNLILGYNSNPLNLFSRTGSHNVVVGDEHSYDGSHNVVVGHGHDMRASGAAALGGQRNTVNGPGACAVGGQENHVEFSAGGVAVAGARNYIAGAGSAIVGGAQGRVIGARSTVLGGIDNTVSTDESSILGGSGNTIERQGPGTISPLYATVCGGIDNTVHATYSTIVSGVANVIENSGARSCIVAGHENVVLAHTSCIVGGLRNHTGPNSGRYGTILGGELNQVNGEAGAVVGGRSNYVLGPHGAVLGGERCHVGDAFDPAAARFGAVVGGEHSCADSPYSVVVGGKDGLAEADAHGHGSHNVILGGDRVSDDGAGEYRILPSGNANNQPRRIYARVRTIP